MSRGHPSVVHHVRGSERSHEQKDVAFVVNDVVPYGGVADPDSRRDLVYDVKSAPMCRNLGQSIICPEPEIRGDDLFTVIAYFNQGDTAVVFYSGCCSVGDEEPFVITMDNVQSFPKPLDSLSSEVRRNPKR